MRTASVILGITLLAAGAPRGAHANEAAVRLADDASRTLVQARCTVCHSADYLQMNSPFLGRPQWEAEVKKMIKVMGAPIPESDVPVIVDYLVTHYGPQ